MKKSQKLILTLLFLLPFVTLIYNWVAMQSGCFHALDLGIYQQAIMDLADSPSWNPENTVRGIRIFADHFDPIILIAAGLQKLIGPMNWVPLVVEFLFYWISGVLLWTSVKHENFQWKVLLLMLWFFNEGVSVALRYPVHPTTWSILPILFLIGSFKKDKFGSSVIWMNILCLFKEYFPFGMFMIGLYQGFVKKDLKRSALVLANAFVWLVFDFYLRPKLFSGIYGHGNSMVMGLKTDPLHFILGAFLNFEWKASLFALFPILILYPSLIRAEKQKSWMGAVLFYFVPIFAIQFLFGTIRFQYGAPVFAAFAGLVAWSDGAWFSQTGPKTVWLKRAVFLMMIYAAGDVAVKASLVFIPKEGKCRYNAEKSDEFYRARLYIAGLSADKKIIATGGLVPVLVRPNQLLYQTSMWSIQQDSYDVIAVGRNATTDLFPLGSERTEKMIDSCRPFATEVILDTKNIFLASGKFTEDCLHQYQPL